MQIPRKTRLALLSVFVLALSACGGSGGGGGSGNNQGNNQGNNNSPELVWDQGNWNEKQWQ